MEPAGEFRPPQEFEEYRLVRELGHGGMGLVYLAHDTVLDRPVAIKFIAGMEPDSHSRRRFLVEARAAARLQHPNVVAVYRVGELGEHPYIVSEYVRGQSLDEMVKPVPGERVLELGLGLCRGLAAAHGKGVLHRDIKPANAMLAEDGSVKLLDFGLAKILDAPTRSWLASLVTTPPPPPPPPPPSGQGRTAPSPDLGETRRIAPEDDVLARTVESPHRPSALTPARAFLGTPAYSPLELWRGEEATHASDVYSLGALLYALCTGRPPYVAEGMHGLGAKIASEDPPPLPPDVDPRLAAVIFRCLRRDPADRFTSGGALLEALVAVASAAPVPPPAESAEVAAPGSPASEARWGGAARGPALAESGEVATPGSPASEARWGGAPGSPASEARWGGAARSPALPAPEPGELPRAAASLVRARSAGRPRPGLLIFGVAVCVAAVAVGALVVSERRQRARRADDAAEVAILALAEARAKWSELKERRNEALAAFDAADFFTAEREWRGVLALRPVVARAYDAAERSLAAAARTAPDRRDLPELLADAAAEDAAFSETNGLDHRLPGLVRRLTSLRPGSWDAPATLSVETSPPGARVTIARYVDRSGRTSLEGTLDLGASPVGSARLPAGSYVIEMLRPQRAPVRLPVLLGRGERLAVAARLPAASAVPDGLIFVPPGRFLFGSAGDERDRRDVLHTTPVHEQATGAFLISRTETTWGQWLEHLRALAPDERRTRLPEVPGPAGAPGPLRLVELPGGSFELTIRPGTQAVVVWEGDSQDWLRWPVTGISWDDAEAYTSWLDRSGRLPGARPCDEREWERAARGADGRELPQGDRVGPGDANLAGTPGRDAAPIGPHEVGSHPASRSPFGLDDVAGNVWEWTSSVLAPGERVLRGGSYANGPATARLALRRPVAPGLRDVALGLRVCARAPGPEDRARVGSDAR